MPFGRGKMNSNISSATPLVSVTTGDNYVEEMMVALQNGEAVELKSAVSHLSPAQLDGSFTCAIDGVFSISPSELPLEVQKDLSEEEIIKICPVHYAVKEGDKNSLEVLLTAGANPNIKDSFGQTPLHILPKADWRNNEADFQGCLDVLLAHEHIDATRLDLSMSTPFSRAEEHQWAYMVNSYRKLNIEGRFVLERSPEEQVKTTVLADTLLKHLHSNNLEEFKKTLDTASTLGSSSKGVMLNESHGSYTLLQYASRCGKLDFVDCLLRHGASPMRVEYVNILSPVMWVAKYGYHKILESLLDSMKPEDFENGVLRQCNEQGETPLHMSVRCAQRGDSVDVNYYKCLQILLTKKDHIDIDAMNDEGNTALHFAATCQDSRAFSFLMKKGAKCANTNVFGFSALQYVCKERMLNTFNDCIEYDTKKKIIDKGFGIHLNYEMMQTDLIDEASYGREMTFLNTLTNAFQDKDILHHPLITIFIYLKWQNIKKFFHLNLILHIIFLGLLLTYIGIYHRTLLSSDDTSGINVTLVGDGNSSTTNEVDQNDITRSVFIAFLLLALLMRESFQLIMMKSWKDYITEPKNIAQLITAVMAVLLLCTPFSPKIKMGIAAWLILISLLEFVLHLARVPVVAVYITMFKEVSWNFFKFLCLFSIIILAFSFSFYLMFQVSDDFKSFPESLLKTIVMTTGEIEYSDLPVVSFPVASDIMMVIFVFLIVLVLMNLLNGLAISDIQAIQQKAEVISCMSLISQMAQLERAFYCAKDSRTPFKRILDYFFRTTLTIKNCLPKHELTVYVNQTAYRYKTDSEAGRTICKCHKHRLTDEHIKTLKQIVMEKKRATALY